MIISIVVFDNCWKLFLGDIIMENNEKNTSPIAKLRAQAKITKNTVTNPKLDMFGNSEAGTTPTPKAPEEKLGVVVPNTPVIVGDDPVEELLKDVENIVAEYENDKTGFAAEEAKVEEAPTMAAEAPAVETKSIETPAETPMVEEPIGATITADVNTNPTIVPEEKVKEKKQRVRVLNSKDAVITPEDIRETKKFAWLAYILFFIPLLINRDNAYVRHNANEGLEMNICDLLAGILILLNAVLNVSNILVSFLLIIGSIAGIGILILTTITKIYMIFAVWFGKVANTPWFWSIRMIK